VPSPVGHMIAGVAAGWLVAGAPLPRARWREATFFAAVAAAPDLDLLVGAHSGPTHSLGAGLIVAVAAFAAHRRWRTPLASLRPAVFAIACAAAYMSHVLLDWLSSDTTAPIGVMALWPASRLHYESDLHLFMAISRRYHQGWTFIRQNGIAFVRELLILVPPLCLVIACRRRSGRFGRLDGGESGEKGRAA
jgi:inner membrane protein